MYQKCKHGGRHRTARAALERTMLDDFYRRAWALLQLKSFNDICRVPFRQGTLSYFF